MVYPQAVYTPGYTPFVGFNTFVKATVPFTPVAPMEDRLSIIKARLELDNYEAEEKRLTLDFLHQYSHLFYVPEFDRLTVSTAEPVNIDINPNFVAQRFQWRCSRTRSNETDSYVQNLLSQDIVQNSNSDWNSSCYLARKKDNDLERRFVLDYKFTNQRIRFLPYPMPSVQGIIGKVAGFTYYSTLDLAKACYQIQLQPADYHRTAFTTASGRYEFKRMPVGLKNGYKHLQKRMDTLLHGIANVHAFTDDVIVCSHTLEEHKVTLKRVLDRLQSVNFQLQTLKCKFFKKKVDFLGHAISKDGITPKDGNRRKIAEFQTPMCTSDVRRFMGLIGYFQGRCNIRDFEARSEPLRRLLKPGAKFVWGPEQQESFDYLKNYFCNNNA